MLKEQTIVGDAAVCRGYCVLSKTNGRKDRCNACSLMKKAHTEAAKSRSKGGVLRKEQMN
ncbi:MAG: hypothetical protein AB1796_02220 [Bacillota bacterium]